MPHPTAIAASFYPDEDSNQLSTADTLHMMALALNNGVHFITSIKSHDRQSADETKRFADEVQMFLLYLRQIPFPPGTSDEQKTEWIANALRLDETRKALVWFAITKAGKDIPYPSSVPDMPDRWQSLDPTQFRQSPLSRR